MSEEFPRLVNASQSGDRKATLEALRDELARRIATAEDRNVAALAARLTDVVQILDTLKPAEEGTPLDEFIRSQEGQSGPKSRLRSVI